MTTKKPAEAGRKPAAQSSPAPRVVEGVTLTRLPPVENKPSHPAALYKGDTAPEPGEILEFKLDNGVTYRGTVAEAAEAAGEVMAEFVNGLKPVSSGAS